MPGRKEVFINGGYYHIFNKTIDNKKIFTDDQNKQLFLDIARFYRSGGVNISFSKYLRLPNELQYLWNKKIISKKYFRVIVLAYSLMPNHFHFLLKQISDHGVQSFMADLANSFTRFLNIKFERKGPLFLPRFHSAVIKSHEQLIHTSRYIHTNHYSSGLVKTIGDIDAYNWCSYPDYVKRRKPYVTDTDFLLGLFNNDKKKYRKFVESNAEYQKTLELIKHAQKWQ